MRRLVLAAGACLALAGCGADGGAANAGADPARVKDPARQGSALPGPGTRVGATSSSEAGAPAADDGGIPGGRGALAWVEAPLKTRPSPELLPDDHVVIGRVRNDSLRRVRIPAAQMRVIDADGETVEGTAIGFTTVGGHGIYPPRRVGTEYPRLEAEEVRTGRIAKLDPGEEVPFVVGWRQADGAPRPAAVDYAGGRLNLP